MTMWTSYPQFSRAEEENQPARDLAARIDILVKSAADLGSGFGSSTKVLEHTFHEAQVTGFDWDPEMTEAARIRHPECRFETADMKALEGSWDLIFSSGSLQWVPDHHTLIPSLMDRLEEDGILAAAIPSIAGEPLFDRMEQLVRECVPEEPVRDNVKDVYSYQKILKQCASSFDLWQTDYLYHDVNPEHLSAWLVRARLEPMETEISSGLAEEIRQRLLQGILEDYKPDDRGNIDLRIRYIFFTAVR